MHNALAAQFHSLRALTVPILLEYDNNIVSHTLAINAKRVAKAQPPIVWKHFQYLTLLLTEIYLDRYFTDPDALRTGLNDQIEQHNLTTDRSPRLTPRATLERSSTSSPTGVQPEVARRCSCTSTSANTTTT